MLSYYNVHVNKNRGKNSRFPDRHWVPSSMIYAFHPTTFFQLGVKHDPTIRRVVVVSHCKRNRTWRGCLESLMKALP